VSAGTIAVEVLLAVAVGSAGICCIGLVAMKDLYERLHYMSTVSTISIGCVLAAVVIEQGWGQAAIKTSLIVLVMLIMNAVLTHATARAARIRTLGGWMPEESRSEEAGESKGEEQSQQRRLKNE
jgi:monovalent cation/proton antiporter MnhG/PhaG subunit